MKLKFPYTESEYAEFANKANQLGLIFSKLPNGDIELVSPPPVPEPVVSDTVLALREKYKTSTRQLCQIAGHVVSDKLEDTEYETVLNLAMAEDPVASSMLAQTTMYCLMQLYRLDGNSAWDRI